MKITEEYFEKHAGWKPFDDDMDRVNCEKAGEFGHQQCGWCHEHELPCFSCGCRKQSNRKGDQQ